MYALGAVATSAPSPTDPRLQAGYQWSSVMDGSNQLTYCPAGYRGCIVYNGFAFYQAKSEFVLVPPPSRPAPPPPPAQPPTVVPSAGPTPNQTCATLLFQFMLANPGLNKCLTQADAANLKALCMQWQTGQVSQQVAAARIQGYIGSKCAPATPPATPPPPVHVPTSNQPTPPQQPPPTLPGDVPATPPSDSSAHPKTFLRQVGPIVGIGLLAAVGLTIARKRSLTKRRRKH